MLLLFFGSAGCRILVPRSGIEPMITAVGAQSLNHWTTREIPKICLLGFVKTLTLISQNMILLGEKVFMEVVKLK